MLKRPHYIALSLVLFIVLVTVNLPSQTATQLKLAIGSLFLPLFGLASSTHVLTEQAGNALLPRRTLLLQLEQLKRENRQSQLREAQSAEIWRENERLRKALQWQQQSRWKGRLGRVVTRDPANWWRTLRIDLGRRDGLTNDLPVLNVEGLLVGRIVEVGFSTSQVALVGDPNCRVSALVEDANVPDYGVITSSSSSILDGSVVDFTYVNPAAQVKPGQRVLTSGLGGRFPRGIVIGQVLDSHSVGFGLYTEARVKLAANLNNLEEVWVVFQ